MIYFGSLLCIIFSVWSLYKYYKTNKKRFLLVEWAILVFVLDKAIFGDPFTIGNFISGLGGELVVFSMPIGIYYVIKLSDKAKIEENKRNRFRVFMSILFCIGLLVSIMPISQMCFEKMARFVSPIYNTQKTNEEKAQEKRMLINDREISFKAVSESVMLSYLKAPSTAKFEPYYNYYRDSDTKEWIFVGVVNSQNGFGAVLAKEYYAYFSPDGQYLTKIIFEDKVIPIHKRVYEWNKWGPKLNQLESEQ